MPPIVLIPTQGGIRYDPIKREDDQSNGAEEPCQEHSAGLGLRQNPPLWASGKSQVHSLLDPHPALPYIALTSADRYPFPPGDDAPAHPYRHHSLSLL